MSLLHPGMVLLAAALIPVIWWLHRARHRGQSLHVPSLLLFRAARLPTPLDPQPAARADPAWIRRALLVTALCLALAGIQRESGSTAIVVWIDGSPSMDAMEGGVSRLDATLGTLQRQLAASHASDVTVRSLARPDFAIHPSSVESLARRIPRGPPIPPEAGSLSPDAQQWVVTDGASPTLARWLATAPIDRIIQAGTGTENTGITLLAVRPALLQPGRNDALVTVHNAGRLRASRRLEVRAGSAILQSADLTLLPGDTHSLHFAIAGEAKRIEARLSPADALPTDDSLTLTVTKPFAARVAVDGDCGAALQAALDANTGVARSEPATAQLLVDCSDRWRGASLPRWRIHQSLETRVLNEAAQWNSRIVGSTLSPPVGLRVTAAQLAVGADDVPVLSTGSRAIAVLHTQPSRSVESIVDLQDRALTAQAEYPLLVATLLEAAEGDDRPNRVASESRDIQGVSITPQRLPAPRHSARALRSGTVDLTPIALALALLALLWESAAAAHALWQNRLYHLGRLG